MCTAISLTTKDHYFGRNLDIDRSYGEEVFVAPRRFALEFRETGIVREHFALIGTACVAENMPLFYDAVNEHGLAMAGLNFPDNAYYAPAAANKDNVASFELIPWILCRCKDMGEARSALARLNITDISFGASLPPAPLHWMISDKSGNIVVEATRSGLHIYENHIGVLTNNPPFPYQLENLKKYEHLRNDNGNITPEREAEYSAYSQGLGAVGLPGDVSSMSRFVRMAFGLENSVCNADERSSVSQFFHLLSSVEMVRGLCKTDGGKWDITRYSACMNTSRGIYYYTTYDERRIRAVDMHDIALDGESPSRHPLT